MNPKIEEKDREHARNEDAVTKGKLRERKLSTSLLDIKEQLTAVAEQLVQLTSRHQKLNKSLEKKERYRSYLLNQSDDQSNDVLKEMMEDIEEMIVEAKKQIDTVEEEMRRYKAKEEELRLELSQKEREMTRLKEKMNELRSINDKLLAEIRGERLAYDLRIRAMLAKEESEQKLQEELRVSNII